ncbi:MAG TPA: cysteine--tRNA ligase [Candidatus Saccharimonadales bacterium]|nr:cysteine--tRNA ligase [Candidatus Saccharimonadales bacterium]
MALDLFNSLSGRIEEFAPADDKTVRFYACGPTVYDYGHIGNFRTFVAVDVLRRYLRQSGWKLMHVMNITDVDDKIIRNANQRGVAIGEYTKKFEQAFLEDMDTLGIEQPEHISRATEHIAEMARFIGRLADKGFAYQAEDGSWYFRIAKFPEYGKLSKKDFAGMIVDGGGRMDADEYEKDDVRDFALWKAPKEGEASWETEIGPGRPGWHIECSTMAMEYLGETFDLHAGGEDLMFPHHENEIAQSEALTGKTFARHWMHVRFLLVEGQKMSKSLGNFYTLRDLVLMGHKPSSIRLLLTSVPYRKQLNFTFDGLIQSANSVERFRNFKLRLETEHWAEGANPEIAELAKKAVCEMYKSLDDDLNTAQALAAIFDLVRDVNAAADHGKVKKDDIPAVLDALAKFDEIFAVLADDDAAHVKAIVNWARNEGLGEKISDATAEMAKSAALSDAQVEELVAKHSAARKAKDFKTSDAVRDELLTQGVVLENTKDGVRWKRK